MINLKDFNDDEDDAYSYYEDPDRYSNYTLVFDTTSGDYTYPTNDAEMNLLIDNTLYVKYMYYSLSNGTYLTWNETDTDLNIEYNLSIANAYFDSYWGIHFGTGYITDDVVSHEWSHGYTQTGCGLIYQYESGAMNEAFSDIFGESVDILNLDTTDPDHLRTVWPTSCHETLNSAYGIPPGDDPGTRWSMGENVTTHYPNKDGSIRDMYKPECFFHPSTTVADYYSCTTYADNGGVHKNSGVLNRLYSVLVDGGEYSDPSSTTGGTLSVYGLGMNKATNLFWRAHQELTPTSQYLDFATALSATCTLNIGAELYFPNVFNSTIYVLDDTITAADCDNVNTAITGSGMADTRDFCPNIDCDEDGYDCEWAKCPDADVELYHEDYEYFMGANKEGQLSAACDNATSKYARVFDQQSFNLDGFKLSCIQFGYFMEGVTDVTINVYIDSTGGEPDYPSLELIASLPATTINAVSEMQVQTVSLDKELEIEFSNADETMVVILSTPIMSEGFILGGGQSNAAVMGSVGETYIGGDCLPDFVPYDVYATEANLTSQVENQWYVRVHGSSTETTKKSDDDDSSLSTGAMIGISVAAAVGGLAILGGIGFFVYKKYAASDKDNLTAKLTL